MAINLDALKCELNVCMGRAPEDNFFWNADSHMAANCLSYALCDYGYPAECFNRGALILEAARQLEAEIGRKTEILAILKKHAGED